jgi:hypothetical protein
MRGFANSAHVMKNGFVAQPNCFVALNGTKQSRRKDHTFACLRLVAGLPSPATAPLLLLDEVAFYWMKSPHFCTLLSAAPQGMIGTVDVEFLGEPSISLSE